MIFSFDLNVNRLEGEPLAAEAAFRREEAGQAFFEGTQII